MSAVPFEQKIGLSWPPTAGWILWHVGAPGGAPDVKNGIDQRPGGFDAVATIKKRGIAAHTIVQESRVGAARDISKTLAIAEFHGHIADAHFRPRALCAKGNGNAFVRLDIQDEAVGFNVFFAENDVRGAAELDLDLRAAFGKALAGSKIERNAGPAPVVVRGQYSRWALRGSRAPAYRPVSRENIVRERRPGPPSPSRRGGWTGALLAFHCAQLWHRRRPEARRLPARSIEERGSESCRGARLPFHKNRRDALRRAFPRL